MLDADGKRYYEDIAEKIERMMFTKTIGPDNFYLQYDVKIGTYNDHGDGPNSTASIIWSAEGSKFVFKPFYSNRLCHLLEESLMSIRVG